MINNLLKKLSAVLVMLTMLLTIGATAAVPASAAGNEISATDGKIRYTGHWVKSDQNMKGYFQSTIEVRFTGTSLKVKSNRTLAVKIDSGDYSIVDPASGVVTAASGLAAGEHKAIIIISTPKGSSSVDAVISGFVIDSGATLLEPDNAKHIAFIGDSITMGHYGASSNWPSGAGYKDSIAKNYVTRVAEMLDMVPNATAIGGIGIEKANSTSIDELGMAERYFKQGEYYSDAGNKAFDTSLYAPDYVVVALGTNLSYNTSTAQFAQGVYETMLEKLREAYPNAKIFCVTPFQTTGLSSMSLKTEEIIKLSVTNRKSAGDKGVYYINATNYISNPAKVKDNPSGQTLDGVHPTFEGHQKIAENLNMSIRAELLKDSNSGSSSKTQYGNYEKPSKISGTTSKTESTTSEKVEDTSSKKTTNKNDKTNSKTDTADKDETAVETVSNTNETVGTTDETVEENKEQGKGIMDYLWIFVVAAAAVFVALLVVIFYPQIKGIFKK